MSDIWTVFSGEFRRKLTSRIFVIGTLIGMFSVVGAIWFPNWANGPLTDAARAIVLVGPTDLTAQATPLLQGSYRIVATREQLAAAPSDTELEHFAHAAAFVILSRNDHRLRADVYARDLALFNGDPVGAALGPLNIALATGMTQHRVHELLFVPTTTHALSPRFADERSADAAKGVAFMLVIGFYMSIIFNAQTIMIAVTEEKTSRIAELLVSVTEPAFLLAGKVLASGACAAVQFSIWLATAVVVAQHWLPAGAVSAPQLGSFSPPLGDVFAFASFFIIGFLQFATIFAAAGSLVTRSEDVGSVAAPLAMPLLAGFILAQYALAFPASPWVLAGSFLPLIAPFVMFARIAVAEVPGWQIAVSLVINLAALYGIVIAAGKTYRIGMLLFGRLPSLRQILAAVRA